MFVCHYYWEGANPIYIYIQISIYLEGVNLSRELVDLSFWERNRGTGLVKGLFDRRFYWQAWYHGARGYTSYIWSSLAAKHQGSISYGALEENDLVSKWAGHCFI